MSLGSEIGSKINGAKPPSVSIELVPYLLATSDAFVILLTSVASGVAYQLAAGYDFPDLVPFAAVGLLASFIYILRMSGGGYYDFPECAKPPVETINILVCWFTTGLLLAFFAFLLKVGVSYSRGAFFLFYFFAPVGLLSVRKATKITLASATSNGSLSRRNIVLLGDFDEVASLSPQDLLIFFGTTEISCFTFSRDGDGDARATSDERILNALIGFVRGNNCREIVLAFPWTDSPKIGLVREAIKLLPVAARLLPDRRVRQLTNYTGAAPSSLTVEVQRAPLSSAERLAKRFMDVLIASIALIALLPVMALAALAIKLDGPGPIIFRQKRKGFNSQEFTMLKFRTMSVQENGAVVTQARRNDPRVTSVGRLLRSASIDELPQLVNVLRGDMSLIGPRPHALAHDNEFQELVGDYAFRHHVKPGLTGWAQCNGSRGATPSIEEIERRVRLDLWYINNWSLLLDVQILIKTFFEVMRKRNAY